MAVIVKKPIQISFTDLCGNINLAPIINSSFSPVRIKEIADKAAGENTAFHTRFASLKFSDSNAGDVHSASVVPLGGGYKGTFSLGTVDQAANSVKWTFKVRDDKLDYLQEGQTLTQKYKITINDGHGGTAIKVVTVVIVGTNDAPVITSGVQKATVTELTDRSGELENNSTHTGTGTITFTDADTLDTHTGTPVPLGGGAGYIGTFTLLAVNQAANSVGWKFTVADNLLEHLDAGETITQTYVVTINDGHGGKASQNVTVCIVGTNDGPLLVVDQGNEGGTNDTVFESGLAIGSAPLTDGELAGGTFKLSDPDGLDDLQSVTINGTTASIATLVLGTSTFAGAHGTLTVTAYDITTGIATYTYELTSPTTDVPAVIETDVFTLTVSDGTATSAPATITINIDDDAPTATAEASQDVDEGATVTGTLDFAPGADGATVSHIGGTALVFNALDSNYSQAIDIGTGSIKVKANGDYSFTAEDPAASGLVSTTFTVTDGDGDTATADVSFTIVDANFPTAGTAAAAVDDDGLTGGNAASTVDDLNANLAGDSNASEAIFTGTLGGSVGGDGAGANGFSFAPSLHLSTATVGTELVTYNVSGNTLTATGPRGLLFTVAITNQATGAYTVTLNDNVLHATGPNDENATDPTVSLGYVITDADGSPVSGNTLTITFDDDAPTTITPDRAVLSNLTAPGSSTITGIELDIDTNIDPEFGADGGTIKFPASLSGTNSGLTAGGQPITYTVVNDTTLQGKVGTTVIFTVTLNPDVVLGTSNDTYSVTLERPIDGGASTINFDANSGFNFAGGNASWLAFFTPADDNSQDLLLTPIVNALPAGSVNTTATAGGVNNTTVGTTSGQLEALRLDFVVDARRDSGTIGNLADDNHAVGDGPGTNYATAANRNHNFDSHYVANGAFATFLINNATSKIEISARDDFDSDVVVGDGTLDSVTSIALIFDGETEVIDFATIGTVATAVTVGSPGGAADRTFTVQFVDIDPTAAVNFAATVDGNIDTIKIATFTANGYSSLEYKYLSGTPFQIGSFGTTSSDPGAPVNFAVPVELVDGDGDTVAASLPITFAPASSTIVQGTDAGEALSQGVGSQTIHGNGGDDTINGGAGKDVLIGGLGNDSFVFSAAADSPNFASADTIIDFDTASATEVIDLAAIFGGTLGFVLGATTATTANSVSWSQDIASNTTIIRADVNGNTTADLVIKLAGLHTLTAGDFIL